MAGPHAEAPPQCPSPAVLRRCRLRFAAVCRHWRHVANQFRDGWSALSPAVAELVIERLSAPGDRVSFASVCSHWRRVAKQFSSPWSDLPPELAFLILRRLMYSYADHVRFAAVCHHWRYVARVYSHPLPPALPWVYSSDGFFHNLPNGEMHLLHSKERELSHGSFWNWLLFQETNGNNRYLKNPFTGDTLRLPTHCKEPVSIYDINGSLGTPSNLSSTVFDIHKVIVCEGDLIIALVTYGYFSSREVVCCRPGMSSWSLGLRNGYCYQDMAVHRGKLYAVVNGGDLYTHVVTQDSDTREPKVSRIDQHVIWAPGNLDYFISTSGSATYLVKSITGKLLLVRWFVDHSCSFEDRGKGLKLTVFEADFERSL